MKEVSAGGVVIRDDYVLVLKKYRGDWVLPKGRLEKGETLEQAAIREVEEESGLKCKIIKYIGYVKYNYRHRNGEKVQKTVHYFYMVKKGGDLKPQKEEGFKESLFVDYNVAIRRLKHYAEKNMVEKARELLDKMDSEENGHEN